MWVQIALLVISTIITILLAPKPAKPKPASLDDFDIPTADPSRPIPVVFGTVHITGANCVWYGNLNADPIKEKGGKK